ncbi:PAAR-like protein [Francisella philomiragia]|uniref:PAAR-like protein n=1 Tax=Francisella philomiragia TaxID=28110 RepID=UPI003511FE52
MRKPIIPTPCPCMPVTVAPWSPPAMKTKINSQPALLKKAKCMCIWGGQISIVMPGQVITTAK